MLGGPGLAATIQRRLTTPLPSTVTGTARNRRRQTRRRRRREHVRQIGADVVDELVELAAKQRQRVVAEVRVAAPLDDSQAARLADVLTRLKGRTVRLNVAVDPAILGGVHVRIGDEVIDGTVATKLDQARRAILGAQ